MRVLSVEEMDAVAGGYVISGGSSSVLKRVIATSPSPALAQSNVNRVRNAWLNNPSMARSFWDFPTSDKNWNQGVNLLKLAGYKLK